MKIGISGGSGQLGKATLGALLERAEGHELVGISRTPDQIGGPAAGRFGDYDQPDSLATAYEGLDHLLIIPTTDMPPGACARQSVAAIDAAAAAGAGRIVIVSSTGTLTVSEPHILASYRGPADELRRIS